MYAVMTDQIGMTAQRGTCARNQAQKVCSPRR